MTILWLSFRHCSNPSLTSFEPIALILEFWVNSHGRKSHREHGPSFRSNRLLKNTHLLRFSHPSSLRRTPKYASLLRISRALHLGIFEQPEENAFFSKLLMVMGLKRIWPTTLPSLMATKGVIENQMNGISEGFPQVLPRFLGRRQDY